MEAGMTVTEKNELATGAQALTCDQVVGRVNLIKSVMATVMEKDIHYGASYPGDTKMNLLKAGADILAVTFQFAPEFEVVETDLGAGHREYRVNCAMKRQATGAVMANGVGCCSTMESKYRWRNSKKKCPVCGKETIIKGKQDFGGGWLCWANKGGCGSKWSDGAREIEDQPVGRVENADIADVYNTVLKIAKKRAQVDATITATGSSSMFTQDAEDTHAQEEQHGEVKIDRPGFQATGKVYAQPATTQATNLKPSATVVDEQPKPSHQDQPKPLDGSKLALDLMDAILNAEGSAQLGDAWKAVMAGQKQLKAPEMIQLKNAWQKRITEMGGN